MAFTKQNRFINEHLGCMHDSLCKLRKELNLGYGKRNRKAEKLYSLLVSVLERLDFFLDPRDNTRMNR